MLVHPDRIQRVARIVGRASAFLRYSVRSSPTAVRINAYGDCIDLWKLAVPYLASTHGISSPEHTRAGRMIEDSAGRLHDSGYSDEAWGVFNKECQETLMAFAKEVESD